MALLTAFSAKPLTAAREWDGTLDRETAGAPRTVRDTLAMAAEMESMRDGMVKQRDAWRERRDAAQASRVPTAKAIANTITRPAVAAQKRAAKRLQQAEERATKSGAKVRHIAERDSIEVVPAMIVARARDPRFAARGEDRCGV